MTTEYLQFTCKTCSTVSFALAAHAPTRGGAFLLRCTSGHQHAYDAEEAESLHLEANQEIRAKMGLN